MNTNMFENPVVQDNLKILEHYGYEVIAPASGYLACGEALDIDFCRPTLALFHTLDQPAAFICVQLRQQFDSVFMAAVQVLLYLIQRVKNIDPPSVIIPAVPGRQAHSVKQEAIQQLCVRGDFLELLPGNKLAWNTIKRKLTAFVSVVVVKYS